jgi:hypothetical protein
MNNILRSSMRGHGELTGNLRAMSTRTMPIDVGSKYAITCGG